MPIWVNYCVGGLAAYLLGAVPFGWLIGRMKGVDIRTVGSGNIGATNVFRTVGKGWGILAFACDVLKGFIPASLFPLLAAAPGAVASQGLALAYACLAVAGHVWPVYLRFKGGKGVATSAGALIGLAPLAAGIGLLAWLLVFGTTRYVSAASIAAAVVAPAAAWLAYAAEGLLLPVVMTIVCALTIVRHKGNIQRLLRGTENRFEFKH